MMTSKLAGRMPKRNPMICGRKAPQNSAKRVIKKRPILKETKTVLPKQKLVLFSHFNSDQAQHFLFKVGQVFGGLKTVIPEVQAGASGFINPRLVTVKEEIHKVSSTDLFGKELFINLSFEDDKATIFFLEDQPNRHAEKKVIHDTSLKLDRDDVIELDEQSFFDEIGMTKDQFIQKMHNKSGLRSFDLPKLMKLLVDSYSI